MAEVEIGAGKSARVGYHLDEVAIVPSRRTRDVEDVDVSLQLDAFRLEVPVIAAPIDAIVSPATAAELDRLGALAPLDLEGLWTRYEDPTPLLAEIAALDPEKATVRLQELYAAPIQRELVVARIREIAALGAVAAGALTPPRVEELAPALLEAELDLLVIKNTVVSAEHVTKTGEALNLKRFVRELDIPIIVGGCASHQAALHLMRTGAVAVIVGVGSGTDEGCTASPVFGVGAPQATAIVDAAGARTRHLEETGVYVQVIAEGGISTGGDIAKAIACGADAVMLGAPLAAADAPGAGALWASGSGHPELPRRGYVRGPTAGTFAELLFGPAIAADGRRNLIGALRSAMAYCGYASLREFHKAEVVVASAPRPLDGR